MLKQCQTLSAVLCRTGRVQWLYKSLFTENICLFRFETNQNKKYIVMDRKPSKAKELCTADEGNCNNLLWVCHC